MGKRAKAAPTPGPRPRGPQARGRITRERILDAALELTAESGPRAVTYRAVAEKAGVAPGVATYHFPSRRELFSEAFLHHLARLRAAATELPVEAARDLPIDARVRLVTGFLEGMVKRDRLRYLAEFELTLELARDPELRAQVALETDVTRAFARDLLEKTGSPKPAEDAFLLSATMEGLILGWLAHPDDRAHTRRVRAAVKRLVELFFPER